MKWRILAVGKPRLAFARLGVEEYAGRLRSFGEVQVEYVRAGTRETEGALLWERSEGLLRVLLDERGKEVGSRELADRVSAWEMQGRVKGVAFLIGGADGHAPGLREKADWIWSLSRLTLQHEMALVLVLEQIYRAFSIKAGSPYHRD
ncbi:MAG: hypothetical protein RLZZ142_2364 [Verrucomicrobiota bacterium]|jgi:23S rRNA (pseudouridine1915-N3)-methyltransferase